MEIPITVRGVQYEVGDLYPKFVRFIALTMSLYAIYFALAAPYVSNLYTIVHLGWALALFAMMEMRDSDGRVTRALDGILFVTVIVAWVYFITNFNALVTQRVVIGFTFEDYLLGVPILLALVEYTRREYGKILFGVIVVMLLYGYFGNLIPGFFGHGGIDIRRFIALGTLEMTGAFGSLTRIAALWIFIFIIWAGVLKAFNVIEAFLDLAYLVFLKIRSGIYQVAITCSMFVGAILGTPVGNIVITGSFTIPLMKERGVKPKRAAAIESVASTGGMVLPPIMGSAAFVMAILTNNSYAQIMLYAVVPAILLYSLIMIGVALAVRYDTIVSEEDLQNGDSEPLVTDGGTAQADAGIDRSVDIRDPMTQLIPLGISVISLVWALAVVRYSPTLSGLIAIGAFLVSQLVFEAVLQEFKPVAFVRNFVEGLIEGAELMAPITIILAAMGFIVSILGHTGLPIKISQSAIIMTDGSLLLILPMVMVVSILFGLGMPIAPAYLLAVTLLGTLMTEVGIHLVTAHFYILYWAMVSAITPPVAIACAVASNLAKAEFLPTCVEALRLGVPYFVLPFAFIFYPNLLFFEGVATLLSAVVVFASVLLMLLGLFIRFRTRLFNVLVFASGPLLFGLGAVFL